MSYKYQTMEAPTIKLSNLGMEVRKICRHCNCGILPAEVGCPIPGCRGHARLSSVFVKVRVPDDDIGWLDEQFVCHGQPMKTTGIGDCNGWECETCGHIVLDVASGKM